MKSNDFEGMNCPIAKVMSALNDRWGVLIMRDLLLGLRRYDELKNSTNITHATLSDRLKLLEKNGLIEKVLYQNKPARYQYIPTQKGQMMGSVILMMLQLGNQFDQENQIAPQLQVVEKDSQQPVSFALVNSTNKKIIDIKQVEIIAAEAADEKTLWRLQQGQRYQSNS